MGKKIKTKERKYFFTQHVYSWRNLLQRGVSDGCCLWIGKEVGAFNATFLVPQTPRGLMHLLAMTGEVGISGRPMAADGERSIISLCNDTSAVVTASLQGRVKGQRLSPQHLQRVGDCCYSWSQDSIVGAIRVSPVRKSAQSSVAELWGFCERCWGKMGMGLRWSVNVVTQVERDTSN